LGFSFSQILDSTASFNAGLFVADMREWIKQECSRQLIEWMTLNTQEIVYGNGTSGGGSQPPMLLVFHQGFEKDSWRGLSS
jgi:lipopolysaccharide biosynthesis glycosyltransferase